MHDKLTGPVFFSEKTVAERSYLDLLELYTLPQLPSRTFLLQVWALPHFCHHVRNHLDRKMAGRWIGRGGPIAWPPRSPDLTPVDFPLWGYVKNIFYQVKINELQHLKARIRDPVATVTPNMLQVRIFVVPPRKPTFKFTRKLCIRKKH
ncbi:hypothetical protein B7P43_G03298 [Cryptotermes secundus]|uniref:Uncharacterized protein n=1 Tax=Cryptotermes secundus TaxID=105785 RepID=A0A2J7PIG6_9NEOP|nr:hypothetical protein B7P43_G03298 [Cryptotermes secundus]